MLGKDFFPLFFPSFFIQHDEREFALEILLKKMRTLAKKIFEAKCDVLELILLQGSHVNILYFMVQSALQLPWLSKLPMFWLHYKRHHEKTPSFLKIMPLPPLKHGCAFQNIFC